MVGRRFIRPTRSLSAPSTKGWTSTAASWTASSGSGDEKYGPDSWGRHDMLAEAMAEMIDLGNYAYLKWRQLKVLQDRMDADGLPRSLTGEDRLGVQP